jgi:hypothetical protein
MCRILAAEILSHAGVMTRDIFHVRRVLGLRRRQTGILCKPGYETNPAVLPAIA